MRIALCNEVVRTLHFAAQCELAAALGYDGVELAPFTVSDAPDQLTSEELAALSRARRRRPGWRSRGCTGCW